MTVDYAVLLPGDESSWAAADADQRAAVYDRHLEFMKLLAERGHQMIGGAELTPSQQAKVVRGSRGSVTVTDGPYAETVEQLTGFYLVRTNDLDDLFDLCGLLAGNAAVEVRALVPPSTEAQQVGSE
jgi:hypothetical protein